MKIGAKVKVTHNPAHDVKFYEEAQAARKTNDGRVGTVMHLRGTLECPAFAVDTGSGVLACYEADELASVPEYQPSEQVRAITRAAEGLDRVVTVARENAALWRADVDALQAAIQGLTGKGGTVASMVGDLADIARDMAALKAAVEAATGQKRDKVADLVLDLGAMTEVQIEAERRMSEEAAKAEAWRARALVAEAKLGTYGATVPPASGSVEEALRVALAESDARGLELQAAREDRDARGSRLHAAARVASALRTILRGGDESVLRCLDDLDKALRGMPLGETRGRQGERFHRPAIDLRPEDLPGFVASLDQHVLGLEQRVTALEYGREFPAPSEGKS